MSNLRYHLFEAFGIELEYMIVDSETLNVKPIADKLLEAAAGKITGDCDFPEGITWSNELALHVIEFKVTEPVPSFEGVAERFQTSVQRANTLLMPMGARLMPTGMHPWMDPYNEMVIWPHEYSAVYEAFNRIFDCRGHGWANVQSCHLNLPFANDDEFAQLHAAIRFLLPILPALSASSPIAEGRITGFLDTRMEYYRHNSAKIPSVAGLVVPDSISSQKEYEEKILHRIYSDLKPHDPMGVLQEEFANARGAMARFSRGAIEIRVLDVQECPSRDVAICDLIRAVLQYLIADERRIPVMQEYPTELLHDLLVSSIREGEKGRLKDSRYARIYGLNCYEGMSLKDLWKQLIDRVRFQLDLASLSSRILASMTSTPSQDEVENRYSQLSDCLQEGVLFV